MSDRTYTIAGLLPCPFCGGAAWDITEHQYGWEGDHCYVARCETCYVRVEGVSGLRTKRAGLEALKRAMNRRPRCGAGRKESRMEQIFVERLVDRVLYVVEDYTAGATQALSTLSQERHDAMVEACELQVQRLLAEMPVSENPPK